MKEAVHRMQLCMLLLFSFNTEVSGELYHLQVTCCGILWCLASICILLLYQSDVLSESFTASIFGVSLVLLLSCIPPEGAFGG